LNQVKTQTDILKTIHVLELDHLSRIAKNNIVHDSEHLAKPFIK